MIRMLIIVCISILSLSKWAIYRLSFMAVLLYYGEKGLELPSHSIIQEYRLKVAKKLFRME